MPFLFLIGSQKFTMLSLPTSNLDENSLCKFSPLLTTPKRHISTLDDTGNPDAMFVSNARSILSLNGLMKVSVRIFFNSNTSKNLNLC